jgi:hypothetical protein
MLATAVLSFLLLLHLVLVLQDYTTFLHVIWWSSEANTSGGSSSSTVWQSTGLLVAESMLHLWQSGQLAAAAAAAGVADVSNSSNTKSSSCSSNMLVSGTRSSYVATNSSLVPILITAGSVSTPQPCLIYVASNITLGPTAVPSEGIAVNRPLYIVGLSSSNTSVDFQMMPNQMRLHEPHSNVTLDFIVMENLGYGNEDTVKLAGGIDVHITANVFAVLYNR